MNNPKHTPGPWKAVEWSDDRIEFTAGYEFSADGHLLPLDSMSTNNYDEVHANARLIAAAPDLLEALMLMLDQFTKTPSTLKDSEARCKAHAAIAKAMGEQISPEADK